MTKTKAILASGLAAGLLAIAAPSQAGTLAVSVVLADRGHHGGGDTFRVGRDRGYSEGFAEGSRDARRGDRFAFADERDYRRGDVGYRRDYGPRPRYVAGFREGFEEGYRAGYRSVAERRHDRRWNGRDDDRWDRRH